MRTEDKSSDDVGRVRKEPSTNQTPEQTGSSETNNPKDESPENGPDNTDDKVLPEVETASLHELARQPSCDQAN
jgi:hypothetical protein